MAEILQSEQFQKLVEYIRCLPSDEMSDGDVAKITQLLNYRRWNNVFAVFSGNHDAKTGDCYYYFIGRAVRIMELCEKCALYDALEPCANVSSSGSFQVELWRIHSQNKYFKTLDSESPSATYQYNLVSNRIKAEFYYPCILELSDYPSNEQIMDMILRNHGNIRPQTRSENAQRLRLLRGITTTMAIKTHVMSVMKTNHHKKVLVFPVLKKTPFVFALTLTNQPWGVMFESPVPCFTTLEVDVVCNLLSDENMTDAAPSA